MPPVMPGALWDLLVLIASLAGILLLVAAVPTIAGLIDRLRRRDATDLDLVTGLLGLTVAGYAAAYGLAVLTGLQVYDRYALPVLPLISVLVLRRSAPVLVPSADRVRIGLARRQRCAGVGVDHDARQRRERARPSGLALRSRSVFPSARSSSWGEPWQLAQVGACV